MELGTLGKLVRKKKGSKLARCRGGKKGHIADNSIPFHRNNRRNPAFPINSGGHRSVDKVNHRHVSHALRL